MGAHPVTAALSEDSGDRDRSLRVTVGNDHRNRAGCVHGRTHEDPRQEAECPSPALGRTAIIPAR